MKTLLALLVCASVSMAAPFSYSGPVGPTGTSVTTSFELVVPDLGQTILDLDVGVNIAHPVLHDLDLFLVHVDTGTSVQLFSKAGKSGANLNVLFSDEAAGVVPNVGPINGTYQPFAALSAFDGENLAGTWRLDVVDETHIVSDGRLIAWNIEGTATTPVPEPGTYALFGLAAVGYGIMRRRRRGA